MGYISSKLVECNDIYSALWVLMPWSLSTRASVVTVLSTHLCVSRLLWVNTWYLKKKLFLFCKQHSSRWSSHHQVDMECIRKAHIFFYTKSWWSHQMETFSALLALCAGNSPVTVNSLHKGHWRGALMFSLICPWINRWLNNLEAGDLRHPCAHYDVIVMVWGEFNPLAPRKV